MYLEISTTKPFATTCPASDVPAALTVTVIFSLEAKT